LINVVKCYLNEEQEGDYHIVFYHSFKNMGCRKNSKLIIMAFYKDLTERRLKPKCLMCEGDIEKSNTGSICNTCKDKLRKSLTAK